MWLYLIVVALVVIGILGGIFAGGIFTIVLVPLALVVLFSGLGYSLVARAAEEKAGAADADNPLPHQPRREDSHVRTSPEGLADARRVHQ
jgi:uncharacterized protein (DUF58 family)